MLICNPSLILAAAITLAAVGCQTDDTGKACDDGPPSSIGLEPVGGEDPVVEVVRMERDGACESFKCLRHLGLPAYCTRECEIFTSEEDTACTDDGDCDEHENCAEDGVCRQDDCAAGFACRTVQKTGPLAGLHYCVHRIGCTPGNNLDCKALGDVNCVEHACFDSCLELTDPADCLFHARTCEPAAGFLGEYCRCEDVENLRCPDPQLICQNPDGFEPWPAGSVARLGICVQAQPPQ